MNQSIKYVVCQICGYIQDYELLNRMKCDPFCPGCDAPFKDHPQNYKFEYEEETK